MSIFLLVLMVLMLVAALERTNRRQSPRRPGLNGSSAGDDRDWARTKLDMLALGDHQSNNADLRSGSRTS